MGKAVGIDLGTTNSVVAFRAGETRVLQNAQSQDLTPSVVLLHKGQPLVGSLAIDKMEAAPQDTILSIKRLMGRGYRDEHVQRVKDRYPYRIVAPSDGTDDDVRVVLDGKEYSPIEVSAMILRKLKEDAKLRLNDDAEYAVITVPAYFTEKQKDATRKAGQLAGLRVQKILDEPTAAAIAFGIDNIGPEDSRTILVYDLGGGTFDVSVLTIVGGVFAQLNIEGDMWCGGDDFDHRIVEHVLQHVQAVHQIDGRANARFMLKLKKSAEEAKKTLSDMTRTDVNVYGVLKDDKGNIVDIDMELTRAQFERLIQDKVKETMELVKTAIRNCGTTMTPDQIDNVLLVGGSSYIPLVRKSLADIFGEGKLLMTVDPMKCVAYGAAALAAKWIDKVECPRGHANPGRNTVCEFGECGEVLMVGAGSGGLQAISTVTGVHYGIELAQGRFGVVIPKGSTYPTPEPIVRRSVTSAANLRRLKVPVYAGFNEIAAENELQAIVWLELPEHVPADTPVDVAFKLDDDGILENVRVSLRDGSGAAVETYLDRGSSTRSRLEKKLDQLCRRRDQAQARLQDDADSQFDKAYGDATRALSRNNVEEAEHRIQEMEKALTNVSGEADWVRRGRGLIGYTEFVISEYGWLLDPSTTMQLKDLVEALRKAVNQEDQAAAERYYQALDKATDEVPDIIRLLMILVNAFGEAQSRNDAVRADKIRQAKDEIESAVRRNDSDAAAASFAAIAPVVKEMLGTDAPLKRGGSEGYLR